MRALFPTDDHNVIIHNRINLTRSRVMFVNQKILPLPEMIDFHEAYKVINNHLAHQNFLILPNNQTHYLRNNADLRIPRAMSTQTKLFIKTRATKTWNKLSNAIRTLPSLQSFKKHLKELILTRLRS